MSNVHDLRGRFTVAVLGANSQVGTELCLFLEAMGVTPVGVARSSYGTVILRKLGITCRHGDFGNPDEGLKLIEGCDVIIDMALPMGPSPAETKIILENRVKSIFLCMSQKTTYIYASTMSVYRLDSTVSWYSWYGSTKRYAEKLVEKAAKRLGSNAFILRLGQVHGEMQSCSHALLEQIKDGSQIQVPDTPSYSVFVYSIAEAVINIHRHKEKPGIYTLISTPEWSWAEIVEWYAKRKSAEVDIKISTHPRNKYFSGLYKSLSGSFYALLKQSIYPNRELVSFILSSLSPKLDSKVRFRYTLTNTTAAIKSYDERMLLTPFNQTLRVPGNRLVSLSDSRHTMEPYAVIVRDMLEDLVT